MWPLCASGPSSAEQKSPPCDENEGLRQKPSAGSGPDAEVRAFGNDTLRASRTPNAQNPSVFLEFQNLGVYVGYLAFRVSYGAGVDSGLLENSFLFLYSLLGVDNLLTGIYILIFRIHLRHLHTLAPTPKAPQAKSRKCCYI